MMVFMKNIKNLVFLQLLVMSLTAPIFAQQEQQKEYVQVVNVELILRVLKDGSPVGGLKKNDFSLYEDGEKSEINGFFEIHRRIAPAGASQKQLQQPRLYLLFFWVDNPAADVEGVLNKFFSDIYREGDRVILSTPLKTFELPSRQDIAWITFVFLEQWRLEAKNALPKRLRLAETLNRLVQGFFTGANNARDLTAFIRECLRVIQEYQLRELSPDMTALEAMARSLLPVKNDKFALVFFQHDTLPLFDIPKVREHCLMNKISEQITYGLADAMLQIELQVKSISNIRKLSEQLKPLFIQANTQFHLLLLSPDRSDGQADVATSLPLTKSEEILSNLEQVLQEISKNTGGRILDDDRMVDALDQVASFEDIYYHITYVPRVQETKKRKIEIRVNQPEMKVIYGRTLEMKELPLVKIAEISATSQFIRLAVVDFYPISKQGLPTGFLNIYVTGNQTDNEPSRLLLSQASEMAGTIELPFAFPQPGSWNLEVRVVDQITGQQAVKKAKVEIVAAVPVATPGNAPDPALTALLAKGAAYAEKLKKTAFGFFCREDVTEDMSVIATAWHRSSRSHWRYDYQIIARDGKITENRVLLERDWKKSHQEKAQLETGFRSFYSFYMPVTILAGEKQHLYQYRLLGKENINKKKVWHIAAIRRDHLQLIPWGEIWVGEKDGAVLKIQIEQTSIIGFEKLAQKAIDQGLMPAITTIHEYNLEKNGICFPTKTTFIERYNSDMTEIWRGSLEGKIVPKHRSFERSRTYFEYKKHRFSFVTINVKEKIE